MARCGGGLSRGLTPRVRRYFSLDDLGLVDLGASPLAEVAERLAAGTPADIAEIDLKQYRALRPPWNDWQHVIARGRHWAQMVAQLVLEVES